jgi:signal transduction histidine kinase
VNLTARRRTALNEALHELRRPLQALALAQTGGRPAEPEGMRLSVQMATAALDRLDREINGAPRVLVTAPVAVRPLAETAISRWRRAASYAGRTLELRWRAGEAVIAADRVALAAALDNLLINAIEHGGPRVTLEARLEAGRLRISVRDSGRVLGSGSKRRASLGLRARLEGRGRRGHGLRVVRRTVAEHGGRFSLHASGTGTEAVIELPLGGTGVPG